MKAICQLCGEHYANVGLEYEHTITPGDSYVIEALRYPLTGAMFGSPDPIHSVPPPFDPSLTWEFFRCPYGRIHRPMVQDDTVLTDEGLVRLPKDGSPAYLTTETGEVDRHSIGDRVLQVSDEEAERQVRKATLARIEGAEHGITEAFKKVVKPFEDQIKAMGSKTINILTEAMLTHDEERASRTCCPTCGKEFPTEKQMKGHIGGAHKQGKKKGRKVRK